MIVVTSRTFAEVTYDLHPIHIGDPNLWIPTPVLESLLDTALPGSSTRMGPPLAARKAAAICRATKPASLLGVKVAPPAFSSVTCSYRTGDFL